MFPQATVYLLFFFNSQLSLTLLFLLFVCVSVCFQWRNTSSVYKIALEKYKEYRYYKTKLTPVVSYCIRCMKKQSAIQVKKTRIKKLQLSSLVNQVPLQETFNKRTVPQSMNKTTRLHVCLAISMARELLEIHRHCVHVPRLYWRGRGPHRAKTSATGTLGIRRQKGMVNRKSQFLPTREKTVRQPRESISKDGERV